MPCFNIHSLRTCAGALVLVLSVACKQDGDEGRGGDGSDGGAQVGVDSELGVVGSVRDAGEVQDAIAPVDASSVEGEGCLEVITWTDVDEVQYRRRTWDAMQRILTEMRSETPTSAAFMTLRWRYADDGRIHAYAGSDFQHDYRYDEQKNLTDFRLTYPDGPDLTKPSEAAVWVGRASDNQYSPELRLIESVETSYGDGGSGAKPVRRVYSEEDERCVRIEASVDGVTTDVETRSYYEDGSLFTVTNTGEGVVGNWCASRTRTLVYHDDGTLASDTSSCVGGSTSSSSYSYLSDGSVRIERHDGLTDVSGRQNSVVTRTAECLEIDAAIGKRADARCRVE
ncbi:MAG: hypothetical protein OEZ06_32570 [Myxococcales bacterium]|nr:hypothetical protein [Myxococcales bacterium]